MKRQTKGNILLFLTTLIWGCTFVAQDMALEFIGPFEYQTVRSIIGALVLLTVIFVLDAKKKRDGTFVPMTAKNKKQLFIGGTVCGFCLCVASCFQQTGIAYGTSAGKAGFITAMYIIFVPIIGLFFGKKVAPHFWLCLALAVFGLYLLCITGADTGISLGDLLTLMCAVSFSFQILAIDHFAPMVDCVKLSCLQFFMSGVFASIPMFIFEGLSFERIYAALGPILFAGVLSCGVAYTLQTIGQKYTEPAIGSLIMSFESFFAVLAESVMFLALPATREIFGCLLMLIAILLSHVQFKARPKKNA